MSIRKRGSEISAGIRSLSGAWQQKFSVEVELKILHCQQGRRQRPFSLITRCGLNGEFGQNHGNYLLRLTT